MGSRLQGDGACDAIEPAPFVRTSWRRAMATRRAAARIAACLLCPLTKVACARIRRREPLAATERAGGDPPMAEVAGVTGLRYWKCLI